MKKIVTQTEELQWIQRYLNGETARNIAKDYPDYNENTISRHIRRAGISRGKNYNKKTTPYEQEIIEKYKQGEYCYEIAKHYNIHEATVCRILKRHGYTLTSGKKSCCVENYFEKIDTPSKAYLLGFITADGAIVGKYQSSCAIEVHEKDKDLILFAQKELNPHAAITSCFYRGKTNYRINFSSKKLCNDLIKMGVTPNKSKTIQRVPIEYIPDSLLCYYFRGLIDGDGCIHKTGGISIYSGSFDFIQNVQKILIQILGLKPLRIYHGTTYFITWSNKRDRQTLYDFLYKNNLEETFYYKRKYERLFNSLQGNT